MHILLTDILLCPRCDQESGLILLVDQVQRRRVVEASLGCPTCHATYAVRSGIADLRIGPAHAESPAPVEAEPAERAIRWAALMGVSEGPGFLLVIGAPAAQHAAAIAGMIEGVEVIAATASTTGDDAGAEGVSRLLVSERLPFYGGRIRGVSLSGAEADGPLLEEAARVVGTGGRLVIEPAAADVEQRLAATGLQVLMRQDDTVVAARG